MKWAEVKIGTWLKLRAIRNALRRLSPARFPLTGPEAMERNYFDVDLVHIDGDLVLNVRTIEGDQVNGKIFTPDAVSGTRVYDGHIKFKDLQNYRVHVRYLCGVIDHRYNSEWTYLLFGEKRVQIQLFFLKLSREISNRQPLAREKRIEILSAIVDRWTNDEQPTSTTDLMVHLHGTRWLYHPQKEALQRYYKLALNSLIETGDVQEVDLRYQPGRQALATLHTYATEQQRHGQMHRQQQLFFVLTFCLVMVGLIQAAAAVVQAISNIRG